MSARRTMAAALAVAAVLAGGGCAERPRELVPDSRTVVYHDPRFPDSAYFVFKPDPLVVRSWQPDGRVATVYNHDPRGMWVPPPTPPQVAASPWDYHPELAPLLRK